MDEHTHHARETVESTDEDFAECPVMRGTRVNKVDAEDEELVRHYDGTRYYLCCDACARSFDANPGKYAVTA